MMKKLVFFLFAVTLAIPFVFGQKTSFLIDLDKSTIDGNETIFQDLGPGDTLLFAPGERRFLLIKNFRGNPENPIVMINSGGNVVIDTDHYFGISIQNCRFFKLTGTGNPDQPYGFQIKRVLSGAGIGIGSMSSDYEIDHVSIENCKTAGIYAKTDPDCSLADGRDAFTQYNTIIHDNYIANVGVEGLYVGSTKFFGQTVQCDGKDTSLLPSLLDGVKIYNNIIKFSGWDGIQVSSASRNCQVFNNTILFDSQQEYYAQMAGITLGGGSKCDCYNNFISNGKGNGIEVHGLGGFGIFNNIILNAGRTYKAEDLTVMKHGIFVTDVSVQQDSSFFIQHNNIINPKSEGIRFSSTKSKKNLIASNVIINPGNFDFYENGNTRFKGNDAYIMFQNSASDVLIENNYLARDGNATGFISSDMQSPDHFKLSTGSVLIDLADTDRKVTFDFSGIRRPLGTKSDIGAFEYDETSSSNNSSPIFADLDYRLLENPVKNTLKFRSSDEKNRALSLFIYNSNGSLVKKFRETDLRTINQLIQVDVSDLSPGIYFYNIQNKIKSSTGKFLK